MEDFLDALDPGTNLTNPSGKDLIAAKNKHHNGQLKNINIQEFFSSLMKAAAPGTSQEGPAGNG
ncbi:hypothetical protein SAMN02746041_00893 [Desulfacinum hydrothermale DSM 13146]|uniref:Uncharacterized protein n=1 Tax=Desulfacinum hydrothermale DSM 13146 TaxID=1121390 RepID=A0A1W1X950_9BACT|nr:hypothetical protein SAMN02746041_00893 [Desulfacinum hydrothermale DSM 13146]